MTYSSEELVINYYDSCESDYRLFWNLDRSHALHAGYWDETTFSLADALERENEVLAAIADIKPTDCVLDAGCGIGGSALYLSKRIGCFVVGITLSKNQVDKATALANKAHLSNPPAYFVMDYTRTNFGDACFDVVWGLESVCHAYDKKDFLKEAYRLLKPGGRLIVADGFEARAMETEQERKQMSYWVQGWGAESLESKDKFLQDLKDIGFENTVCRNATENAMPSSKRLYRLFFPALVYSKIGQMLGFRKKIQTDNIWGAYYQHRTLKKGLWEYLIFSAIKPFTK